MTSLSSLAFEEFIKSNPSFNDSSLTPEIRQKIFERYNFEVDTLHPAFFHANSSYYEIIEKLFTKKRQRRKKVCLRFDISDYSVIILYLNNYHYGIERYFNGELQERKKLDCLRQGIDIIENLIKLSKDIWNN